MSLFEIITEKNGKEEQNKTKPIDKIRAEIENLEEGITIANKISESGDVVLLSPACASWGMFKNFEERGNKFIQLVKELK